MIAYYSWLGRIANFKSTRFKCSNAGLRVSALRCSRVKSKVANSYASLIFIGGEVKAKLNLSIGIWDSHVNIYGWRNYLFM
jgi:hypothetical protein